MALIELNKNPSQRELRQFAGILFPAFCGLVGALVWLKGDLPVVAVALWVFGALIMLVGLAKPTAVLGVYLGLIYAGYPIGWTVSHVILGALFYLLMTPIGLIMRLCGYDPLERKIDRQASTYWIEHDPAGDSRSYFRQF